MARKKQEPVPESDNGKEYQIIISGSSDYKDVKVISTYPTIEIARDHYMSDVRKAKEEGKASGSHYAIREVDKNPKEGEKV